MTQSFHTKLAQTEVEISEEADRLRAEAARLDEARRHLDAALQALGGAKAKSREPRKRGLTGLVLKSLRMSDRPLVLSELTDALLLDPAFSDQSAEDLCGPVTAVLYRLRRTGIIKHDEGHHGSKAWTVV